MNFKQGQIEAVNTLRHAIPKTKKKTLQIQLRDHTSR